MSTESLGARGLTVEQQKRIAEIQAQTAASSLKESGSRFSTDRVESTLYVGELAPEVDDEILKKHFSNAKSVHVCRDNVTKKSLGYAYVNFYRSEECREALQTMNYSLILGRPCRIMVAERDSTKRKANSANIVVKNLPPTVDGKALYDTFSQWGNVVSCRIIRNPNATRGYGYVNYDTFNAAERAIQHVNGSILFGREISASHQVSRSEKENSEDPSRQHRSQSQQPQQPRSSSPSSQTKFTNIYVKNLAPEVTEDELRDLFASFGRVSSLLIQRDDQQCSKGFGFVNFENPDHAEQAMTQLHDTELYGKKLFVSRAQKKAEREDELRRQHEYQPRTENPVKYQGVNLYVKNLADQMDDETLRQTFAPFGQITSAKVMRDERTGASKGFGFVCFTLPEEATDAVLKMNGQRVLSKEIYVALAQRKEDRRTLLEAQMSHLQKSPPVTQQLPPAEPSPSASQMTLAILEPFTPETQRQMLGERIYPIVSEAFPQEAGKLTGMLLELDKSNLVYLINNPKQLVEKASEAAQALKEHHSSLQSNQ
ncbi:Polyadenylate-binding protein, cytoplasmic and nuclear [Choanephora cucurbitarum]|uniref:Polyadenylate-binding protein, cytoplasmic and nuclear n=1 Tax=Choanephora cucurbitarum TaxID=101091 RepID=A0A1C7NAD2_9FUNG|nr:Polyadenylate-binding protein, cytoplasmic and nuclear [Choanephora cucurbitarum]